MDHPEMTAITVLMHFVPVFYLFIIIFTELVCVSVEYMKVRYKMRLSKKILKKNSLRRRR